VYWVGCAAACDEQARRVAEATLRLLRKAEIPFGVLGSRERCSGDFARRVGDEGLFQNLAAANTRALLSHRPRRIVTHCPHCLNAFRREYELGGVEILHHAAFLLELVAGGRLQPARPVARTLTFHDPCYLTRYHGLGQPPRALLGAIPGCSVREMPRNGARALCCGGGGGQVLVDVRAGGRIPDLRFEEARATGAEWIATACPFCKIMLAPVPAERGLEGRMAVRDVAEVLAEACL
jgi:Fe-S oxidoreductase